MKKKLLVLLAVACATCLSAALLAGCSSSSTPSESSDSSAPENNTLIVGFDSSYPPYGYVDENNEYTGFDLDLAAEVCERNGWELELQAIDWDAKDALLNQGNINCIWNGFTMEGREDSYTFSEAYMLNEQVIVVKAGSGISSLDDLAGKTVVTQADSAAYDLLTDEESQKALGDTFGELQTLPDYNNCFMQLESGMVDAVACDLSIAAYQMSANEGTYEQLEEPLNAEHYAVGFKQGSDALAQTVTDTLKEMYEDGTVEELCAKYADYGLSFDNWVLK